MVLIWDGLTFQSVDKATAQRLISEDKAEIVTGAAVKYRHQFAGYRNRAMTTYAGAAMQSVNQKVVTPSVDDAPEPQKRKRGRPRKSTEGA